MSENPYKSPKSEREAQRRKKPPNSQWGLLLVCFVACAITLPRVIGEVGWTGAAVAAVLASAAMAAILYFVRLRP